MKRVLRKVVDLQPYGGTTSRGNPEYWRSLLECGHVKMDAHSARQPLRVFAMQIGGNVTAVCKCCAAGRPISAKLITVGDIGRLRGAPLMEVLDGLDKMGLNTKHARKEAAASGRCA